MTQLDSIEARVTRWAIWGGPAYFTLGILAAFLARVIPFPAPTKSGAEIAAMYADHTVQIRIGLLMFMILTTWWAGWFGVTLILIRRMERKFPIMTYLSIIMVSLEVMIAMVPVFFWSVAAFRPDQVDPNMTRMLNDLGWIIFSWPLGPWIVYMVLLGLAILWDQNEVPVFPRWVGWATLGAAFPTAWGTFITLNNNDGPWAWNGLFGIVIPLIAYTPWIFLLTVFMFRYVKRSEDQRQVEAVEQPPLVMPRAKLG